MTYITDSKKFEQLSQMIKPFACWKLNEKDVEVCYFDWIEFRVDGFVPFINAMLKLSGDKKFYVYDFDSLPVDKFFTLFKKYPIIELVSQISEEDYFGGLQEEPGEIEGYTHAISTTSAYAIFPESMKWHIYGEYDIELARLVTKVGLPKDVPFPHDFIPKKEAKRLISLKDE